MKTVPLAAAMGLSASYAVAADDVTPSAYDIVQQHGKVTGRIVDAHGEPLVGVNVVQKGASHNGAVTDMDGSFAIQVPADATLVIRYIGYRTVEMPVRQRTQLTVTMQEDSEALDEIVVIGYGAVRKADLAGSVAVMDNKSFRDQPVTRVEGALQGRR